MPSSMVLTSPVLIEVDHAFGVACELLIECVELFVPPLKRYRTVYGLEDLGPLIPEWSGPTPITTTKSTKAATISTTTTEDKRVHPTIVIEQFPGIAA